MFTALSMLLITADASVVVAPPPAPTVAVPVVALPDLPDLPEIDGAGPILSVAMDGGITQVARDFLVEAITEAEAIKAQALLIRLDTPGGLLQATREIVAAFLNSSVPIIVWVGPSGARAGSAGVFITMAAHIAVMAPGTNIGAAHPVSAFGKDIEGDMAKKVTNDTVAWARSIAQLRGRNAAWAEEAVRESASIPEGEAKAKKVIDLVARSEVALIAAIDGWLVRLPEAQVRLRTQGVTIIPYAMSARQELVQFLANPNLAYILLLIGMFGLFLEFKAPGLVVPGVVGATCIALVLGVQVMPINWLGVLLLVAASICLIAELFVPSFGILTVLGLVCMMGGSFLLFDVPESDFRVDFGVIIAGTAAFAVLALTIGGLLLRTLRQPPSTGPEAMIGLAAKAVRPVGAAVGGRVELDGTTWAAISQLPIAVATEVVVAAVDGIVLTVRAADETDETDKNDPGAGEEQI
jgi:membrane-bound serine protease (ClpP class)